AACTVYARVRRQRGRSRQRGGPRPQRQRPGRDVRGGLRGPPAAGRRPPGPQRSINRYGELTIKQQNSKAKRELVNDQIDAKEVRLMLEDGTQQGIVPLEEARGIASQAKLDLVMIAPEANPPVC